MSCRPFSLGAIPFVLLLSIPFSAPASECLVVSFLGVDPALADEIRCELRTELKIPIDDETGGDSCRPLVIELNDKTAVLSLLNPGVFKTQLDLDNFLPDLWPRAIALSAAGLWILAQGRPDRDRAPPKSAEIDGGPTPPPRGPHRGPEESEDRGDNPPRSGSALHRTPFQLTIGVRLLPKLRLGVFEGDVGVGVWISAVVVDLMVIGLWGRKTLDTGRIVTTGIGLRGSVFWRGIRRQAISLGIGPALEIIGVFGYGRADEGVASQRGWSPVINILLFVGGWFTLSSKVSSQVALGGGWSAMYFDMQSDGETVSGVSGGSVNLLVGFSFGCPAQASPL